MAKTISRKVIPTGPGDQTKERILAAAEPLFARSGFDGVSMRDVGTAAEVPFALITYHFETKLGLYRAVFRRREEFITSMRLERLRAIRMIGDARHDIHLIAQAVVEPLISLRTVHGGADFTRLMAREVFDPLEAERGIVAEFLDPVALLTIKLLQQAAPQARYTQVCWAFYFASGALAINHSNTGRLERLSLGKCQTTNTDEMKEKLTNFLTTGWTGMLCPEYMEPRPAPRSRGLRASSPK